ncbi:hypothetical protein [Gloeocapsa sp. PCC 7428]|nr:hypothetical protein [Gloeocapsa sp. PCC 7428]
MVGFYPIHIMLRRFFGLSVTSHLQKNFNASISVFVAAIAPIVL